jgi:hypothetical protein
MPLAEIRAFDITHLDTGVPELEGWHYLDGSGLSRNAEFPEDEGAGVNQRQAEKVQRLMQLYSAQDLTGLNAEERAAQEQEMTKVYTTSDEEELDTALATAEPMARAKVESGGERTPPRPTEPLAAAKQVQ